MAVVFNRVSFLIRRSFICYVNEVCSVDLVIHIYSNIPTGCYRIAIGSTSINQSEAIRAQGTTLISHNQFPSGRCSNQRILAQVYQHFHCWIQHSYHIPTHWHCVRVWQNVLWTKMIQVRALWLRAWLPLWFCFHQLIKQRSDQWNWSADLVAQLVLIPETRKGCPREVFLKSQGRTNEWFRFGRVLIVADFET